ncbi:hypothetical protein ABDD95_09705 [Mucilaginibacter sp. PAMB04274]|uniref:hypothetical protein n=1 Tax=Mucilaginibacter sp. PAMB04274 TaxID=3138568 RepID=UPI0031F6A7D6
MNSKIFNSFVLAVCGVLFCVILADVSGKWSGYIDYNGNDIPLTYNFKADGDKLTGTSDTPLGTADITDGKIDKDMISFKVDLNGSTATHIGKVYQDSIKLKITYNGADFLTTLKRNKTQ